MIFQALKAFPEGCAGSRLLSDCSSPAAEAVKAQIQKFQDAGAGIRQTFDYIVKTWGEKVLTEQALQIRQMRKKTP
jgi:cytochrome c-type biogenesis protein CcmH/NrfF